MAQTFAFHDTARLPMPGDNAAIATRRLDVGTVVDFHGEHFAISHTVLEGHRFAVQPISAGEQLLSWGLSFGVATRDIVPGAYLCNPKILYTLRNRDVDFALPALPNFQDVLKPYVLDETTFTPGVQVSRYLLDRAFMGYERPGERGIGTRNFIIILGTTSRTASFARALEERVRDLIGGAGNLDGIVAVTHTEGGGSNDPNNREFLLRTLAGFIVHPNVGAALVVDEGDEAITNRDVHQYLIDNGYPLADVRHEFFTMGNSFAEDLARGAALIEGWVGPVGGATRTEQSLANLKIALQCGGSDAFSGVSGNPLAAWVAREVICYGGSANLAETDELIGSEHYVLQNVRDLATAHAFLARIEQFRERLSWHGQTAEGNPSGGNNYRGLYNIAIKSIGAAMKRNPDVRLDYIIDYSERMSEPGYYFMDSPGNDLESIAGQVASGCNMIFFVTGNGSITNFPFVPTIKIITTTGRYNLLSHDMDVNAGAYLDGTPMDQLGRDMFDLTVAAASGARTIGEKAAHSQVSIWRNWVQRDRTNLERLQQVKEPPGEPLPVQPSPVPAGVTFDGIKTASGYAPEQIGLIMPTSICASQIARKIAEQLNAQRIGRDRLSRFMALPHTEGCGASGGPNEVLYARTVMGHLVNPLVGAAFLLEHGCEKTHNDYFRHALPEYGIDPHRYGWGSIQLDGGIDAVMEKAEAWAKGAVANTPEPEHARVGLQYLRLGVASLGAISPEAAESLARLTLAVVNAGGTVVVPETASLLTTPTFRDTVLGDGAPLPTLAYGQEAKIAGFHVMETPTDHWVETLTGLAATGIEVAVVHIAGRPVQGHRLVPLIQATSDSAVGQRFSVDLDLVLSGNPAGWTDQLLSVITRVASREYTPKLYEQGNTDIQFTRGPLGVSL